MVSTGQEWNNALADFVAKILVVVGSEFFFEWAEPVLMMVFDELVSFSRARQCLGDRMSGHPCIGRGDSGQEAGRA